MDVNVWAREGFLVLLLVLPPFPWDPALALRLPFQSLAQLSVLYKMRPLLPHTSLLQHTLKLERVINWAQAVPWEELQLSEQPCMQAGYFPLYFAILKWHLLYPSSHIKIMHLSSPYLLVCAVFVIFRHFILVLAESSLYCWNFRKKKLKQQNKPKTQPTKTC